MEALRDVHRVADHVGLAVGKAEEHVAIRPQPFLTAAAHQAKQATVPTAAVPSAITNGSRSRWVTAGIQIRISATSTIADSAGGANATTACALPPGRAARRWPCAITSTASAAAASSLPRPDLPAAPAEPRERQGDQVDHRERALGIRQLDLEAYTNYDGKVRFTGLPARVHQPPLAFRASKGDLTGMAVYNPESECKAQHEIVMTRKKQEQD